MMTQDEIKSYLDYDNESGVFRWKVNNRRARKGNIAGSESTTGYIQITINYKNYNAHRLAWIYIHGKNPSGVIDHINRIKTDNRISNLRDVSESVNGWNKEIKEYNKSGFQGVFWHGASEKYQARINVNRAQKHLGVFKSAERASISYRIAKHFRDSGYDILSM